MNAAAAAAAKIDSVRRILLGNLINTAGLLGSCRRRLGRAKHTEADGGEICRAAECLGASVVAKQSGESETARAETLLLGLVW